MNDHLFPSSPDFRRCRGNLCKPGTAAASGVDFCSAGCARDYSERQAKLKRERELYREEADRRGHA